MPFSFPYWIMSGKSKSGIATFVTSELNENAEPYHFQSNKIYCSLCFTAKSMFSLASFVVCVITRIIFPGFIQLVFCILEGAFRFKTMLLLLMISVGFSPMIITRQ